MHLSMGKFLYYMYDEKSFGASLFCIDYDIMIWMHVEANFLYFYVFYESLVMMMNIPI